jgi:phosphatidylserine/phosphatidylglycerophosphate/cardiolipin synthase-like enzyme
VKLVIEPDHGVDSLLAAISAARRSIEIVIFRLDRPDIEAALKAAVARGVAVCALIAYTNRGGELNLRKLEMRLLEGGVAVSRTASDLARYHDKLVIIDRRVLFVLSFNFTDADIEHSRAFGVVTRNARLVKEAVRLFEADTTRQPFTSELKSFVVSPVNSRKALGDFIEEAQSELLIYDPKIADPAMVRLLAERKRAGITIKVIGQVSKKNSGLETRTLTRVRLHTRIIVRDRRHAFLGSQSLRTTELDERREVGIISGDERVVAGLTRTFEADWLASAPAVQKGLKKNGKVVRRVAKGLARKLTPLSPVVKEALKEARADVELSEQETKASVREAVKEAVRAAVRARVEAEVKRSVSGH